MPRPPTARQALLLPDSESKAPTGLLCEARPIDISASITGKQTKAIKRR